MTKDGHSPLMQVLSRLQLPWWTDILVPNSVSTWTSDMQVACSAQSPQPSQTRLLIHTDSVSAGRWPRLRSRRSSAAQGSWWMSAVTPGVRANSCCAFAVSSRCTTVAMRWMSVCASSSGSGVVMMTFVTPSMASQWVSSGTPTFPMGVCPPVMATASL